MADQGDLQAFEPSSELLKPRNNFLEPDIKGKAHSEPLGEKNSKPLVPVTPKKNVVFAKSDVQVGSTDETVPECCKSRSSPTCIPGNSPSSDHSSSHYKAETDTEEAEGNAHPGAELIPDYERTIKIIQNYQGKFPRIKKSLLYSNSPDFAEYEKLLQDSSPLCAPNTIYFLRDPETEVYRGRFTLYCKSQYKSAFKVKSSSSKASYGVSPHRGFISPGEQLTVVVEVRPKKRGGQDSPASPNNIFKHAALGIFTAVVDPSLEDPPPHTEIGAFWEQFERKYPNGVAGHFIKRFFTLQPNGDVHFPTCTHNIIESISPSFKQGNVPQLELKERHPQNYSFQDFPDDDDYDHRADNSSLESLHIYNSTLLEILLARSKLLDTTMIFQFIFLALFVLVIGTLIKANYV